MSNFLLLHLFAANTNVISAKKLFMRLLCLFYLTWHSVIKPKKLPKKKRKRRKPGKSILMLNSTTAQSVKRFCTSELPKSCGINRVICNKMNWQMNIWFASTLFYILNSQQLTAPQKWQKNLVYQVFGLKWGTTNK